MPFKTTSFVAEHYPNTYMEQFCKALHPDLELGTVCVAWFRQATKHCADLLNDVKSPITYFWTTVKNLIFPERAIELMSLKIPININPTRLSIQDCQSLCFGIVSDYVQRAPRFAAESTTNVMLWQVLYSLMGIMALGSLLVAIILTYNKYGHTKHKLNMLEEIFKPEKRMQAITKRSLRLTQAEMRNIDIKTQAKMENIVASEGCKVLTIKAGRKYDFLESLVVGNTQSVGKFHRLYDQHNKTKTDFKIEPLKKAMKFLDNDCKKLHVLLTFEEDVAYEEEMANTKRKSNSPRTKSLSPLNCKRMLNNRLEGGDCTQKAANAGTPRKQVTTPRSSGVASSGIPRTFPKVRPLPGRRNK